MRGKGGRSTKLRGGAKMPNLMKKLGLNKVSGETVVICVLLVVLLVLVVYYVRQNNEGFDADNSPKCDVYIFVADWCPHCKNAKPAIEEVKNEPPANTVVNVVNEKDENSRELMNKYNIKGFPTVVAEANGNVEEMNKALNAENINNFVKELKAKNN